MTKTIMAPFVNRAARRTGIGRWVRASVVALAMTPISGWAHESFVGNVTWAEPTYLPGFFLFKLDVGNATCPAGSMLQWHHTDAASVRAVYATVLLAMTTGRKINFVFNDGDTQCIGRFMHIVS